MFRSYSLAVTLLALPLHAADWPQFLGPEGNATSQETGWNQDWTKREPQVIWKADVGTGCASFAVAGGRAITTGHVRGKKDTVWCFDAVSGEPRWKVEHDQELEPLYYSGGPSATPLIESDRVYVLNKDGVLRCLAIADGKEIWSRDYVKHFGGHEPKWGYAASPIIVGDALVCEPGGDGASAVALNKLTGELLWKSGADRAAYTTPALVQHDGSRSLAFFNIFGLVLRDLSGQELARVPWPTQNDVNAAQPLVADGHALLTSDYGSGAALFDLSKPGSKPVWKSDVLALQFQNMILHDGHVYAVNGGNTERATLRCIEFMTGRLKWQERLSGNRGSILLVDGRLIVQTDGGEILLTLPEPGGYQNLGSAQVNKKTCWAPPAFANGLLYTRSNDGKVACVDLRSR
jgi:outer membrane protein assembly factor BamB